MDTGTGISDAHEPSAVLHRHTTPPEFEPFAIYSPPGEKHATKIAASLPPSVALCSPDSASQIRAEPSFEVDSKDAPSGESETFTTGPECLVSVASAAPVATSQIRTKHSPRSGSDPRPCGPWAVAIRLLSGLNVSERVSRTGSEIPLRRLGCERIFGCSAIETPQTQQW